MLSQKAQIEKFIALLRHGNSGKDRYKSYTETDALGRPTYVLMEETLYAAMIDIFTNGSCGVLAEMLYTAFPQYHPKVYVILHKRFEREYLETQQCQIAHFVVRMGRYYYDIFGASTRKNLFDLFNSDYVMHPHRGKRTPSECCEYTYPNLQKFILRHLSYRKYPSKIVIKMTDMPHPKFHMSEHRDTTYLLRKTWEELDCVNSSIDEILRLFRH